MKITVLTVLFAKTLCGVLAKTEIGINSTDSTNSTEVISACTYEYLEEADCLFYNDRSGLDSADWIKYYGRTPSKDTGPNYAIVGKYYMYIETTTKPFGGNARLISSFLNADTKLCLSFFYHMYGDSIGELQVILNTSGSNQIIFNKSNNQGNKWHYKELYFQPANDFQIVFNGIAGKGYNGDIALDHIVLFLGDCNNDTLPSVSNTTSFPGGGGAAGAADALSIAEKVAIIIGSIMGIFASIGCVCVCREEGCKCNIGQFKSRKKSVDCETISTNGGQLTKDNKKQRLYHELQDNKKQKLYHELQDNKKQKLFQELQDIFDQQFQKQKLELSDYWEQLYHMQKSKESESKKKKKRRKKRTSNKVADSNIKC